MITTYVSGENVELKFTLDIKFWIILSYKSPGNMEATLLKNEIVKTLENRIKKIREDAYTAGWKDKSAKKYAKRTYFNGSIASDYVGH